MFFCSRDTGHPTLPAVCGVLIVILLLQGCAAHSSIPVTTPLPPIEDPMVMEAPQETPIIQEALPADDEFDDEDDFFGEDDFFDEEGLSEEFEETPEALVADPLAPFNRLMFGLNDKLLLWVVKPVATGYRAVTPTVVRRGVSNFFDNLKTPVRLISSLLQGKIKGAGSELGRFLVNSTVGVLGFADPADHWLHLQPSDEDLGQVLGAWGVGNGMYIVWPLLGPSSLRDSASIPGYFYLNPVGYIKPAKLSLGISAYEKLNEASFSIDDYVALKASALDPYTFIRDLYIQSRNKKVQE
ncbi:VacJ family lipoprotein [Desulfoluna sp.]|uniref:MlaA family lipoprotein n=1 Tax=Desulfoluna sp. TaxID=2045199 RepID=UPI00260A0F29|nr:VacJ family lipoprotein [Desulfoluna sp.]